MKARVKAQDHINFDAVGCGTASVISRALKLLMEYESDNHITVGLAHTANAEIESALEEAEAMKNGVAKELRKQRRMEAKAVGKSIKSDISEIIESNESPDGTEETGEVLIGSLNAEVDKCD